MPSPDFLEKLRDCESPEHSALLSHVRGLIEKSRSDMGKNYTRWDENDAIFRAEKRADTEDRRAQAKGQPQKMIVPLTAAQIMTFVAFNIMVLTQNRRFFEMEPTGTEDNPLAETMELLLERDLRRNTWQTFLVQFFLDIGRFGLGAAEVGWSETTRKIKITEDVPQMGPFGTESTATKTSWQDVPVFTGNRIFSVSPYRFFPDTSLPIRRYQEGAFCGSEDMFTLQSLRSQGDVLFNLDKIPKFSADAYKKRRESSRIDEMAYSKDSNGYGAHGGATSEYVKSGSVVVTKLVFEINPSQFEINGEKGVLGEEDFDVRFVVWYANDRTIIRFEEAAWLHGMFPYIAAQFLPDQQQCNVMSLADSCNELTGLITWLINAMVTSKRSNIKGKYIIDPAGVDVKNLQDPESQFIYLKKNASQTGVDRYIQQFATIDPTVNWMQDVQQLKSLVGEVTGYNETMNGQYSAGRRSATQDRVVAQAGAARGKTTLSAIWDLAFEPLGRQLISNNRQEMSPEVFFRVLGTQATPELFDLFAADALTIASAEDFFVFDGTIPSEKSFLAQSLQEILSMIFSNPQVAAMLGYGPEQVKSLMNDMFILRGVTPARLPAPVNPNQAAAPMMAPPAAPVTPQ